MRKQRGVTMIGWIFLLIPMAITLYAAIRVAPVYMNHYKLVSAMEKTATQLKADEVVSPQSIRNTLSRHFDTGYVDDLKAAEIDVQRGDGVWSMTAEYEKTVPLFGNMHLLMAFKKTVSIS